MAFNRPLDAKLLGLILERQFVEVVIAPTFDSEAVDVINRRKMCVYLVVVSAVVRSVAWNLNVLAVACCCRMQMRLALTMRPCSGHKVQPPPRNWQTCTSWKVAWFTKSNAIEHARDAQTIGVGAGQMSRVISTELQD